MDYLSIEEGKAALGLKLVLTAGVPGPWGEAAKAILQHKGIAFTPVFQEVGGENSALIEWTGQSSAPVIVTEGSPPVCHWLDLLMFAERLAPEQPLVPDDMMQRSQVIGLSALIAGVDGFGWNRRLHMLAPMMALPEPPDMAVRLATKFGWSEQALEDSARRLASISAALDSVLADQESRGSNYFVSDQISAADVYWANFAGMVKPLGAEDNPMPEWIRSTYQAQDEETLAYVTPRLEAHRDMMYAQHLALPLDY